MNSELKGPHGIVDCNAMPKSTETVAVLPSGTWHFLAWNRDALGGQTTSSFIGAAAVICP